MKLLMPICSHTVMIFTDGQPVDDGEDLVIGESSKQAPLTREQANLILKSVRGGVPSELPKPKQGGYLIADKRYFPAEDSRPPIPPPEEYKSGLKNWHGVDGSQWKWAEHRNSWIFVARPDTR